jgi:adenine specific DNA methylase mod
MAALNDLINQITDTELRDRIQREVDKLAKQKKFGLVFEEHLPECTPLYDMPIKPGCQVMLRDSKEDKSVYTVLKLENGEACCVRKGSKEDPVIFPISDIVRVAEFGEPIYPYLKPLDTVCNAPDSDLWHALIEADNYHALQLLEYLYAGKVDCIYIDPPYNTGARDWKYNNDYVDGNDAYRHSKWLSMMKKRLGLAKRLLNPNDSVLIVTIDEKEYLHLGCLLEDMFPDSRMQMVTCVISSQASVRDGMFSRSDEYIFFLFQGDATVAKSDDDMLNEGQSATKSQLWFQFVRTGKGNLREDSKNLFYPIYADPNNGKIMSIGEPIPIGVPKESVLAPTGQITIWPMTADGKEARWRTGIEVAKRRLSKGLLRLGRTSRKSNGWSVLTVNEGTEKRIENREVEIIGYDNVGAAQLIEKEGGSLRVPKTVWNRVAHNAGWHGSKLVAKFLADRKFSYPKSLYSVMDAINVACPKKDSLIIDFFAGSGTTLHAVNLLNALDNGHRRCILVTNNEVSDAEAKNLLAAGYKPGDSEWEDLGIAQYVTWPRTVCSIIGQDVNGNAVEGNYLRGDIPMADGFKANAAFFQLGFLDKTAVALGRQFKEMLPTLWMKAGAHGSCPTIGEEALDMLILPENRFAVLVNEKEYLTFAEKLEQHPEIETVFIITDSESGYRDMISGLDVKESYQLYRDYLDNFRINAARR